MTDYRKRVLVFGATGEIGGRVARGCAAAGCRVTGVSRGENRRPQVDLEGVEMVRGDKGDAAFVARLAAEGGFEVVVDSVFTREHARVVFECFRGRLENYLVCSSTGTYVPLRYLPADEEHPWREKTAVNFHGQSERDAFVLDLWREQRFPVTILRPTNIGGVGRVPTPLLSCFVTHIASAAGQVVAFNLKLRYVPHSLDSGHDRS